MAEEENKEENNEAEEQEETPAQASKKAAERLEAANKKTEELLIEQKKINGETQLGGQAEAGAQTPEPVKLTDIEYAEQVKLGKANPMEEDGFL